MKLCLTSARILMADVPVSHTVFEPGVIAVDQDGHVAAGTSTNGLNHKVPGYVNLKLCFMTFFYR